MVLVAIVALLDHKDHHLRITALKLLGQQPALAEGVLTAVVARLDGQGGDVQQAAVSVLDRQPVLPAEMLIAVAARLDYKDWQFRCAAIQLLRQQLALPNEVLVTVAARPGDEDWRVRRAAFKLLDEQPVLSDEVLAAMVTWLDVEDFWVPRAVEAALRKHSEFYRTFLRGAHVISLYNVLLVESFKEQLSWYTTKDRSCVNMPDGIREILIHSSLCDFKLEINRARPKNYPSNIGTESFYLSSLRWII